MNVRDVTIKQIQDGIRGGDFSAADVAGAYKDKISAANDEIGAYLEVFDDASGIPIAVKDNMLVAGREVTAASKILEGYTAPYDATAILRLRDAGFSFLGRTNMDEFAMGSSTENSAYSATRNPHDTERVPGGSSGGSAAAVAAGLAPAALGSDTGGSIRQPASFCGVVGLKPTYGAVSRSGLIAMGSSLDQIGPITKTVEDAQILFEVMRGEDPLDSTTLPNSAWKEETNGPKNTSTPKLTIGVPWHLIERDGIDDDVLENFKESVDTMKELGWNIKDIELPAAEYALAVYYIIMPAEVSSNLARFDGVKYGAHAEGDDLLDEYFKTRRTYFGAEVRRRIILGTYVLSAGYYDAYYNKAVAARRVIRDEFTETFQEVDIVATPTTPTPAFRIGEKTDDPLAMYLSDIFTVPANIAGIPALSLPDGTVTRDGTQLPTGLQLMGPHTREDVLFDAGKRVEEALA